MSIDELMVSGERRDTIGAPRILEDLADGRLDQAETEAVLDWLLAADDVELPAPWLVSRAVRISRQAVGGQSSRPTLWGRVTASLLRDTRLQPRVAGARAIGPASTRLLYGAGGVEIDVELAQGERPGQVRILGQVIAAELDLVGARVTADGPTGRAEADVDELGQFALDGLAAGPHRLEIGVASGLIEIGEMRI